MGRPGLTLHRKFRRLERALGGAAIARGTLELIWDASYEAGDPYIGDAADVASRAGWAGDENKLCAALVNAGGTGHAGFLEQGGSTWWADGATGTYRVHDLYDHAPDYVQKRLKREEERRCKGKTIADLRSEAGKRGAAASAKARDQASGRQPSGQLPPPGVTPHAPTSTATPPEKERQPSGNRPATDWQIARTPAPAPAPAPGKEQHPLAPSQLPEGEPAAVPASGKSNGTGPTGPVPGSRAWERLRQAGELPGAACGDCKRADGTHAGFCHLSKLEAAP